MRRRLLIVEVDEIFLRPLQRTLELQELRAARLAALRGNQERFVLDAHGGDARYGLANHER